MSERKKIIISIVSTFLLTSVIFLVLGFPRHSVLDDVRDIIKIKYVEEIDDNKFDEYAASGAVASLGDVYSYYLSPENYKALMSDLSGEYRGIGVEVYINESSEIEILAVFEDTPAYDAKLAVGDIVLKVDGKDVGLDNYEEAIKTIRGSNGEDGNVTLTVRRGEEVFDVSVTRADILIDTVFAKDIEGFKYLRISSFNVSTAKEFSEFLENIPTDCPGLIIDLRANPGGLLNIVTRVADMLLPKCNIVYTQTRQGKKDMYNSKNGGCTDIPLVILTNSETASASEILAGAVKDNSRGTIVGEKTFGKGCVQEIFSLKDGGALKLTTMYYYTPSGVCIQGTGISPDIEVSLPEEARDIPISRLNYDADTQLQKAVEILKNK